jgi:hypothetical protein
MTCIETTIVVHKHKRSSCERRYIMKRLKRNNMPERVAWSGFGTLEVIIIIAVLITVALLFRENIIAFARNLIDKVFSSSVYDQL